MMTYTEAAVALAAFLAASAAAAVWLRWAVRRVRGLRWA